MAVSLDTKLLWFDRGAAAFEQYAPGVIEQAKGPHAPPHYVCPICLEGFAREAVSNGTLTEEHVPPEALGGRGLVLTCKTCNNTAGTKLDAHAHRQQTCGTPSATVDTVLTLKVLSIACTDTINAFIEAHRKQLRVRARRPRKGPSKGSRGCTKCSRMPSTRRAGAPRWWRATATRV